MGKPSIILLRPETVVEKDKMVCHECLWSPIIQSSIQIEENQEALRALKQHSQHADVIFWVSPSAVMVAKQWVSSSDKIQHIAVGQATAQCLRDYGFKHVLAPIDGQDSEAVLRLPLWKNNQARLLIIRGESGREYLSHRVRELGWSVHIAEVYRRCYVPVTWTQVQDSIDSGNLKAVYTTTAAGLMAWHQQWPSSLRHQLKKLLYLTHHSRIVETINNLDLRAMMVTSLRDGLLSLNDKWSSTHE